MLTTIVKGGVVGLMFGMFFGCIGTAMVLPAAEEGSLMPGLIFFLVLFGVILVVTGFQYNKRIKQLNMASQHEAWQKNYWSNLDDIMRNIQETDGQYIAQQDYSAWHGLYRPKAGEQVLWMGESSMTEQREKVTATTRIGAVKFAKLPFSSLGYANIEKVIEHKVKYDHAEGRGVLVITPQRLTFVSSGHGQNWSMDWNDLMSWQPAINAIMAQPSQGQPKAFVIHGAGFEPIQDTQVIDAMMGIAHDMT